MKSVTFIGSASGWGAQVRETEMGPEYLQKSGVLNSLHVHWIWKETLLPSKTCREISLPPGPLTLPYIEDFCLRLSSSVEETLQNHQFPVIIGGDHVIAVGTWAGVVHQLQAKQKFGLIWIDAHMDAHTMETTPSKAFHGMPLAALLGFGEPSLVNVLEKGPLLNPQHVCLIGVRSYEEGEEDLLKRLGVRIYYMKEVQERGFESVFKEAVQLVKDGTQGYGISIDLDAFDPEEAPGVGTPAPQGLQVQKVLPFLKPIQGDPQLKALEIVEFNPDRDKDEKTLLLLRDLLKEILEKDRE